jgi:hypothetical protein
MKNKPKRVPTRKQLGSKQPNGVKRRHKISPNKKEGCKLLIMKRFWSGRPGSNRRRPAWESQRRLITKD